jgi:Spy/CpxP family protein refolding chaperone
LNLTAEQRSKIADVQRAAREQSAPVEAELRTTERSLHRELFADSRDSAKIAGLSAKVSTLRQQLADAHVRTSTAISDVLTAEQRASIREREARGRGPGRGAGGFRHGPVGR